MQGVSKLVHLLYLYAGLRNAAGHRQGQGEGEAVIEVDSWHFQIGKHAHNESVNGSFSGHGLMHHGTQQVGVAHHHLMDATVHDVDTSVVGSATHAHRAIRHATNNTEHQSGADFDLSTTISISRGSTSKDGEESRSILPHGVTMSVSGAATSKDVLSEDGQHELVRHQNSAASLVEHEAETITVRDAEQSQEQYDKVAAQFYAAHVHAWKAAKDVVDVVWQWARQYVHEDVGGVGQYDESFFQSPGSMLQNSSSMISFQAIARNSTRQKLFSWGAPTFTIVIPWPMAVLLFFMVICMTCACTACMLQGYMAPQDIKIPNASGYETSSAENAQAMRYGERLGSESTRVLTRKSLFAGIAAQKKKIPSGQMLLDVYDESVKASLSMQERSSSSEDKAFIACPQPAQWAKVGRLTKTSEENVKPAQQSKLSCASSEVSTASG
mmetsp:Transcript_15354/g.27388  ORF Transcript_15354/g.27388 Transcript_15354/m.27388 type:complete len:440 (+) Transcript_15354:43-1362(+)